MNQRIGITVGGQRPDTREALSRLTSPARSLYIHVPFCFHKCHYCDFYSFVDTQDRQAGFVDRLLEELESLGRHAGGDGRGPVRLETIFVGGGTPSLLRPDLWSRVLAGLHAHFDLSAPTLEFTVECNPETVTSELMATLAGGGVNRVSVGAQSFESRHLKTLERWHDPENVTRAMELADGAGIRRRNIDLIFGIPQQTVGQWESDLRRAMEIVPSADHLSCYALTYEPNTAMTQRLKRGEFTPMDEDSEVEMYTLCVEMLRAHGLERYEVSNFARPGSECRHNLAYWRQEQWLAAGPSASAHIAGQRWKNVPRLTDWMEGVAESGGYSPMEDFEGPDAGRALAERLMMGLRIREGVDAARSLADAAAMGRREHLERAVERQTSFGLLTHEAGRWTLTERGYLQADGVAAEMMGAIDQAV